MKKRLMIVGMLALATGFTGAAMAHDGRFALLDSIEPGLWDLRMRDGGAGERICVNDGRRFIQLRHPASTCRQIIVGNDEDELTVQYSCPGQGFGRTRLRVESARLVQVETQGIADRSPFEFTIEARRIGACSR